LGDRPLLHSPFAQNPQPQGFWSFWQLVNRDDRSSQRFPQKINSLHPILGEKSSGYSVLQTFMDFSGIARQTGISHANKASWHIFKDTATSSN